MTSELSGSNKVVGAKQAKRALRDGRAVRLFMAVDADPRAAYFRQVRYGRFIRMALIMMLLGIQ